MVTLAAADGVSGEQELELTYNGALASAAPRRALVASGTTADRVTLAGRGLAHAAPHTPAVFTVGKFNIIEERERSLYNVIIITKHTLITPH